MIKETLRKLLKRLPKKYHERVENLEAENGLIDDCKYMLYFRNGWKYHGEFESVPVRSMAEAIEYIKDSSK